MFPLGFSLIGVLQIACIIHVLVRRKEYYWILILLFMPVFGAIVYAWTQILPDLRRTSLSEIRLPIFQKMKIKELERNLEDCDSVDNRVSLAEMYAKFNRHEEALKLVKDCMNSPVKDSPDLIFTYAVIQFQNGNAAEALTRLEQLDKMEAKIRRKERQLLHARVLDKLDRPEAEDKYKEALKGFDGEEARYWYADFLMRRGRLDESVKLAEEGIKYYKRSEALYRRVEAYWYSALKMVVNLCGKKKAEKST